MTPEERLKILMETGEFDFLKNIPEDDLWKLIFALEYVRGMRVEPQAESEEEQLKKLEEELDYAKFRCALESRK